MKYEMTTDISGMRVVSCHVMFGVFFANEKSDKNHHQQISDDVQQML